MPWWSFLLILVGVNAANYTVVVQTACSWFSGTEARIFLTMTGKEGRTVSAFLPNHNHFGRCATDAFIIFSNIDLKEICQITIGHDNTGLLPGWNLQSVLILSGSFKAYNFPINRWLSKKKGDRHTVIHSTRCAPQSPFFVTKQEDEFASPDERPNYVDRLLHPHLQNSRHRTNKHSKDHASGRHTGSKEYEKASSSSSSAIGEDEEKELDDSLAVNIPHPHKSNGNDDSLQTKIADALLAQNDRAR